MCEYEDLLFSSLRFLEKLCLVCSFRFHKTHSSLLSLLNNHPHSPLKISLSFISLFFRKNSKFSSLTFRPRLASFWPKRWYERYNKYLKRERISSFTQKKTHLLYKHNVCCYSTNRVHRRPQGHQGSGAYAFFFFSILVLGKRSRRFRGARARFSLNSLFAYPTLKDTKIHTWEKKGPFGDDGNLSLARAREKDPSLRV